MQIEQKALDAYWNKWADTQDHVQALISYEKAKSRPRTQSLIPFGEDEGLDEGNWADFGNN